MEVNIEELKNEFNPRLQLRQYNLYGKISKQPVTLKKCEHLFYFVCLVENIKVNQLNETICSKCKEPILPEYLVSNIKTNSLLKMLAVACI